MTDQDTIRSLAATLERTINTKGDDGRAAAALERIAASLKRIAVTLENSLPPNTANNADAD